MAEKNMAKYHTYVNLLDRLKIAMDSGFFYEAVFIEYALFEDQLSLLLKYAGIDTKMIRRDGTEWDLFMSDKIDKIEGRPEFHNRFVRARITMKILKQIKAWKKERDDLCHHLANLPYSDNRVKAVAEEGDKLIHVFKNKVSSVKNRLEKQRDSEKGEQSS